MHAPDSTAFDWQGQTWVPDGSGGLWWPARATLVVADLHLGKVGHFRKAGIALPQAAGAAALRRLDEAIARLGAERLLVLGDLAHSDWNRELEAFRRWRTRHRTLVLDLVPGNHDVLPPERYAELGLGLLAPVHREAGLAFCHDPAHDPGDAPCLSGHVHPGVVLKGGGRQRLRLPCFWFAARCALLPAMGAFTGSVALRPRAGERVWAWTGTAVRELPVAGLS